MKKYLRLSLLIALLSVLPIAKAQVYGTPSAIVAITTTIGGSLLSLATCTSNTTNVTGATVGMGVSVTPTTYPGDGFQWQGYVSSPGVVTLKICALGALTPVTSTYNIRVFP